MFQILLVHLDDIIFSKTFDGHLVVTRLTQYGLEIKPQKCTFLSDRVSYLGHIVLAEGVETGQDVSAVKEWGAAKKRKGTLRSWAFVHTTTAL